MGEALGFSCFVFFLFLASFAAFLPPLLTSTSSHVVCPPRASREHSAHALSRAVPAAERASVRQSCAAPSCAKSSTKAVCPQSAPRWWASHEKTLGSVCTRLGLGLGLGLRLGLGLGLGLGLELGI